MHFKQTNKTFVRPKHNDSNKTTIAFVNFKRGQLQNNKNSENKYHHFSRQMKTSDNKHKITFSSQKRKSKCYKTLCYVVDCKYHFTSQQQQRDYIKQHKKKSKKNIVFQI